METMAVYLYVLEGLADWEIGYATAGINSPEYQLNPGRYTVRTVGATGGAVRTMGGLTIVPDLTLDEVDPSDGALLILPGSDRWLQGGHDAVLEKAGEFLAAGVPVAAICGATAGLARHGLLDDRRHTSNAREFLAAVPGYGGAERYVDEPAVRDGGLVTASGTAPIDFARQIFEQLEVYAPEAIEAWYTLYRHGDPAGFYALAGMGEQDR
jgi:putative intracellular protease/amidase